MVEPVDECVGAGEVIGAGPHISAFYSVQFPHSISEKCFLKSEIKQMVFKQRLCCVCDMLDDQTEEKIWDAVTYFKAYIS